ncbi:MAG: hypothetical protein ACP5KD_05495 [Fervidobacterium sp.]
MEFREIVFWSIFLTIAVILLTGQIVVNIVDTMKPVVISPSVSETLPDISKEKKNAVLVYENNAVNDKLEKLLQKGVIYGLSEYSGPDFNEQIIKDGAIQLSYQEIIKKLEQKKELIKKSLSEQVRDVLYPIVDSIFTTLYQLISEDSSLGIIYKIWKEDKGQIVTYYVLTIFDDDYGFSLLYSVAYDSISKFEEISLDFSQLWHEVFKDK